MVRVVGVRFKKAGKVYYFDPAEYPIATGSKVVVETARGVEYGEVAVGPKDVSEEQVVQPLKKVLRVGSDKDAVVAAENKRKETEAFGVAQKKIEGHSLEMNLVDVEYTFDGSKIIFYFTAEGRIDFRELVRDLAGVFRTRIEMRQIGVRDEAKLLGGIGPCGRILCCTSFLGDFAPVSIRMAKDQNLSLNPSKISGLCGRLMCCLRYEQETYEAAKKDPTLAPGYVPPVLTEGDVPELAELEDRPTPLIGVRNANRESGMSARIAQAAGVTVDRPARREERRGPGERPQGDRPERPQAERAPSPERPQNAERPQGGDRQAQPQGRPRPQGERPQGDRPQNRPQGGDRQAQQQGRPPRPQGGRPQGERPQGDRPQGQRPQGADRQAQQQGRTRPQGERPQGQRPPADRPQGDRPQGERPAAEGAQAADQQRRNRHHRHRRRGGGNGQPQGGGPEA